MQTITNLQALNAAGVQVQTLNTIEISRGLAWSCTIVLNGKKLGMVSNEGCGGMTRFDFPVAQKTSF
jgi:hypothetical protein